MDKLPKPNQGTQSNPNLDSIFISPDTFFPSGTWHSPVVPAISSNNNNRDHFPSANSNLFQGHEENNTSARQPSDNTLQPPFSADLGNGTNSKFRHQTEELVSYLLHQASQQWETSRAATKAEIIAEVRREMNVEVKQQVEELSNKLQTQLSRYVNSIVGVALREFLGRNPFLLTPIPPDNTKAPQ